MVPTPCRLVIKPTLACTARCPTCALRTDLFEKRQKDPVLDLAQWGKVMRDARQLGFREMHISGGEPTLDPRLVDLVAIGRQLGMTVNMNTNGSAVTPLLARQIADAGLDSVTVSLYSHRPDRHDAMRREPGLFERALRAIEWFQGSSIVAVDLQTTLVRDNLLDFSRFLEMSYRLGAGYLYVSYLEGDRTNRWLAAPEQIRRFREQIIPCSAEVISRRAPAECREEALQALSGIFAGDERRMEEFSRGEYHPAGRCPCTRPYDFALILANGDVLPCNGVEYCHSPIQGNLFSARLPDLWHSGPWDQFRRARHAWCRWCPVTLHFRMPILGNRTPSPQGSPGEHREAGGKSRAGIT